MSGRLAFSDYDLWIVDTTQIYTLNDQYVRQEGVYAVNAWFLNDWKPLAGGDIDDYRHIQKLVQEDCVD
jgi:hypothetical protein